jgi:coenzyme F420-0:L-glutamate ligase / coenzyme F420-1:gamma-L-glutamate ligase
VRDQSAPRGGAPPLLAALTAIVQGRRSVRRYRPDPVPPTLVEAALAAAARAPSPHHSAPWRFVVLVREEVRARLADAMGVAWRRDLSGDGLPAARVDQIVGRSRERLLEAPVLVLICLSEERFDRYPDARRQQAEATMFAHSVGAALQNFMLAAHAGGLASCWMCAPLFCPDTVVAALGLSAALRPQALLTVGYALESPPERPPLDVRSLVALWD